MIIDRIADLAAASDARNTYTYSNFLSLAEQDEVLAFLKNNFLFDYSFYGGSEASERKICIFGSIEKFGYEFTPPVCILRIEPLSEKFADKLSHRDYLGAVLNLGIDRSTTGDIIIRDKTAWIYCLDSMAEYISDNLTRVRHTSVRCIIETETVPALEPSLITVNFNTASERIDAFAAAVTGTSRAKASALIKSEKVFVNGRLAVKENLLLKEGDIVTLRGCGKYVYNGIIRKTKKDRLLISADKYV